MLPGKIPSVGLRDTALNWISDFVILYNMNEEVEEGYTDWIRPIHDNIPETKLAPTPQCRPERYKVDYSNVDSVCTPFAGEILKQHRLRHTTQTKSVLPGEPRVLRPRNTGTTMYCDTKSEWNYQSPDSLQKELLSHLAIYLISVFQ
jgi:hypothetical protein